MAKFSSTNPLLSSNRIADIEQNTAVSSAYSKADYALMSLQGTARKTLFLVILSIATALYTMFTLKDPASIGAYGVGFVAAAIIGFISIIVMGFKASWSPVLAPVYAICEGFVIGMASAMAEFKFPGIAAQAALLTIIDAGVMFFCFSFGIIKVTAKFRACIMTAGIALCLFYLASLIMGLFGFRPEFMAYGGTLSIGVNIFAVVISSLFLLLDFDSIAEAHGRVPKVYEWYFGACVLCTLVWMYLEILRLLSQFSSRD